MSLQSPYRLVDSETGYIFETDYGNTYELSFLLYPLVNDDPRFTLYMFNIEPIFVKNKVKDVRIELTVRYTLELFFEKNSDALITIMDSLDGKHRARKRLFDSWYKNAHCNNIEKADFCCNLENMEIISSLFVGSSNPLKSEITQSFQELVDLNFYCD